MGAFFISRQVAVRLRSKEAHLPLTPSPLKGARGDVRAGEGGRLLPPGPFNELEGERGGRDGGADHGAVHGAGAGRHNLRARRGDGEMTTPRPTGRSSLAAAAAPAARSRGDGHCGGRRHRRDPGLHPGGQPRVRALRRRPLRQADARAHAASNTGQGDERRDRHAAESGRLETAMSHFGPPSPGPFCATLCHYGPLYAGIDRYRPPPRSLRRRPECAAAPATFQARAPGLNLFTSGAGRSLRSLGLRATKRGAFAAVRACGPAHLPATPRSVARRGVLRSLSCSRQVETVR